MSSGLKALNRYVPPQHRWFADQGNQNESFDGWMYKLTKFKQAC